MPSRSRALLVPLLTLAAIACGPPSDDPGGPEPGGPVSEREVHVEIDGLVADSRTIPSGFLTVLSDAESGTELAVFEYDQDAGLAALELVEPPSMKDVRVSGGELVTLDNVHALAMSSYTEATDDFRLFGYTLCCWVGDYDYCGYIWSPDYGETICCGYCTVYD
jgi:hypothetical protein